MLRYCPGHHQLSFSEVLLHIILISGNSENTIYMRLTIPVHPKYGHWLLAILSGVIFPIAVNTRRALMAYPLWSLDERKLSSIEA